MEQHKTLSKWIKFVITGGQRPTEKKRPWGKFPLAIIIVARMHFLEFSSLVKLYSNKLVLKNRELFYSPVPNAIVCWITYI